MNNPQVSDPNEHKVVEFTNKCDFTFTPEMGCMFNGSPIFGITGAPGINAGESMKLPYHVAQRLAVNLAKIAMTRQAPAIDPAGIPTGVPLWDTVKLENLKNSYLTDLYTMASPIAQTETERLMQMVADLNKTVEGLVQNQAPAPTPIPVAEPVTIAPNTDATVPPEVVKDPDHAQIPDAPEVKAPTVYQDKKDVIVELEKRGIQHDKRKSKSDLEKLLNA